jgi:hypothetical protein
MMERNVLYETFTSLCVISSLCTTCEATFILEYFYKLKSVIPRSIHTSCTTGSPLQCSTLDSLEWRSPSFIFKSGQICELQSFKVLPDYNSTEEQIIWVKKVNITKPAHCAKDYVQSRQ